MLKFDQQGRVAQISLKQTKYVAAQNSIFNDAEEQL
jgi:hypothetical protein